MNVSFTRARSKLVIFGSRSTLRGDPLLAQFFELMESQGWVYDLPPDAHLVHEGAWSGLGEQGDGEGEDEDDVDVGGMEDENMLVEDQEVEVVKG